MKTKKYQYKDSDFDVHFKVRDGVRNGISAVFSRFYFENKVTGERSPEFDNICSFHPNDYELDANIYRLDNTCPPDDKSSFLKCVLNGFAVVSNGDKFSFYNLSEGKLCKQKFDKPATAMSPDGLSVVVIDGKQKVYSPTTEHVFKRDLDSDYFIHADDRFFFWSFLYEDLLENPEEFEYLPTEYFRNKDNVLHCLKAISLNLKNNYSKSSKTLEKDRDALLNLCKAKIQLEKQILEREDKKRDIIDKFDAFVDDFAEGKEIEVETTKKSSKKTSSKKSSKKTKNTSTAKALTPDNKEENIIVAGPVLNVEPDDEEESIVNVEPDDEEDEKDSKEKEDFHGYL